MARPEPVVNDLARAVLDGANVDWEAAESSADPQSQPVVRQLRVLAGLARVHRDAVPPGQTRTWTPAIVSRRLTDDTPERWGHLQILERIGRGAFGAVYRAWDPRLDREVALKVLPASRSHVESPASSIIEEGRLLARVRHANVVTIHGAEQIGDQIGLWMELVRGQTLEQLLQRGTTFSAADTIAIGLELCGAVSAVHAAGLLHRDIKAHNVTRADDGRVVLMDFGAGRELDDESSSDLTGTPLYLAPEVFRGEAATVQSDVYCLGVLLYHLLTGNYPVRGRTLREVRAAHERGERVGLREARPDLPAALARVIDRAIDPDPEQRYRTADALRTDLTVLTRRARVPVLWLAAASIVVALAAGGTWALRHTADPSAGPRIAVLTFENLGSGPDDEAITKGLTHEIQRNLASLDGLVPLSFTSSSAFPTKGRNLKAVGKELRADLILEGSMLRSGHALRVHARLVRVADDAEVWADTFDRQDVDIFKIQDDISAAIVNKLRVKLKRGQRQYHPSLEVYYLVLKARALLDLRAGPYAAAAADLFEQVTQKDPSYAPAWAALASALAEATRIRIVEPSPLDPRLTEAARKAIQLDELLADSHAAMGNLLAWERNWREAEAAFLRAIDLNPSLTTTHHDFVVSTLLPQHKIADARRVVEDALNHDPTSLPLHRLIAYVQINAGEYDRAIENCRWVLERDPEFPWVKEWIARSQVLSGRPHDALPFLESTVSPLTPALFDILGYTYAVMGRRAEAEAIAARFPDAPARRMLVYAGLGDNDRAFAELERVIPGNPWRAATYLWYPEAANLHTDPRMTAIKKRLGLPE